MTELQNDRQDKNNMPPDLRFRGHKNKFRTLLQFEKLLGKDRRQGIIYFLKAIY